MPYPHYRRPTPALDLLPRRHCACCGNETRVEELAPFSPDLPAPEGVARHYSIPVCSICRTQQYALPDLTSAGKRAEDARYLLGDLANREARLLGEEKW